MPALTPFIQHSFGSPSRSNQRRKREESHPDLKEKLKLLLFTDDMILHRESPEDTTKELLGLINELVQDTKLKHRNMLFYIYQQWTIRRKKDKKYSCIKKIIKGLWINLTKDVKDLYSENSNTLMKEVKDNTDKWENTHHAHEFELIL